MRWRAFIVSVDILGEGREGKEWEDELGDASNFGFASVVQKSWRDVRSIYIVFMRLQIPMKGSILDPDDKVHPSCKLAE